MHSQRSRALMCFPFLQYSVPVTILGRYPQVYWVSPSARSPVLPTKPVRATSALVGKAYSVAGQAAACLHTMSLLQAYQAELLPDLDECEGIGPNGVYELRRATDLSLRAIAAPGGH